MMTFNIKNLFVNSLQLFNEESYVEFEEKSKVKVEIDEHLKTISIFVTFYELPTFKELFALYAARNETLNIIIKLECLYSYKEIYQLIKDYADRFEFNMPPYFSERCVDFEFPVVQFQISKPVEEVFFSELKDVVGDFLRFVFNFSGLHFEMNKQYDVENKNKKGEFCIFVIDEINSKYTSKCDLAIGITNYVVEYYLFLSFDKKSEIFHEGELKVGSWYEMTFVIEQLFSKNYDGRLTSYKLIETPEQFQKSDLSTNKICCLSSHSKFSAFDGLYDYADFAKLAKNYGHPALAVTDFASVQSFPKTEQIAKKLEIKPIYGCEFEVMPEKLRIVINAEQENIDTTTLSFFDIETTGLNPIFDEMIEIAITKYRDGTVVDRYHNYVNIGKPLKPEIVKITKITDEVLKERGKPMIEVLKEVKEFVGNSVLIAHNGIEFDLPFLASEYKKLGLEPITNPLIDTMVLSRAVFLEENFKSHALGAVAKRFNIEYDPDIAHSAAYDTDVLFGIWTFLSTEIVQAKFDYQKDLNGLNDVFSQDGIKRSNFGHNILVYAKNQEGIKSLYKLITLSHTKLFYNKPTITFDALQEYRENLVVVSSTINSPLVNQVFKNDFSEFERFASYLDYVFLPPPSNFRHLVANNFFTEEEMQESIKLVYQWSLKCGKKVIFNYCAKFLDFYNEEQYRALVHAKNIGGKRHYLYSSKFYDKIVPNYSFRTTDELLKEFQFLNLDADDIYQSGYELNKEFVGLFDENIQIIQNKLFSPKIDGVEEKIKNFIEQKLDEKYGTKRHQYILDKIDKELSRIIANGFSVVYWVSHILVKKSVDDGYLVGSRGSVGSSFVAHLLNISEVNPLEPHYYCKECSFFEVEQDFIESGFDLPDRECPGCGKPLQKDGHNIPFETFLGLKADKVPDIDLNFSGEYQAQAHNFLKDLFGENHTFRSGTISTVAKKTAYALAFNYLNDENITYNNGKLFWISRQLIDIKRTSGQHPGGILIIPAEYDVHNFTPVNYPANDLSCDWMTTHFEFQDLHDTLFKFDVLGHDDPTFLALLFKFTGKDPRTVEYKDRRILELFSSLKPLKIKSEDILGETTGTVGLPEFGTQLTRKILRACEINSFADLIRISGISHGTNVWKGNIDNLIKSKKQKLNEVITCRDDIMIYLNRCGLNLSDAFKITESVRKGKGVPPDMIPLMKKNSVPDWYIQSANKISYIFPKAHATAYVLMSWKIAYYKLEYPLEFYAAYFSIHSDFFNVELLIQNDVSQIRKEYKNLEEVISKASKTANHNKSKYLMMIYEVAIEMLLRGFKFKNISMNESHNANFIPIKEEGAILIPFISIEGLGKIVAKGIVLQREEFGIFVDREDVEKRTKLNNTVLKKMENLAIITKKVNSQQLSITSFL